MEPETAEGNVWTSEDAPGAGERALAVAFFRQLWWDTRSRRRCTVDRVVFELMAELLGWDSVALAAAMRVRFQTQPHPTELRFLD